MVCVHLLENLAELRHIFLGQFRSNKVCCYFFKLTIGRITLENLVNSLIFLKFSCKGIAGVWPWNQSCLKISSIVIL